MIDQQLSVHKDNQTQNMLNKPLADPTGVGLEDQQYLEMILKYIDQGKIELYVPFSLLNTDLYNQLDEKKQGELDLKAVNVLSAIREIKDLFDAGFGTSFQIQNAVKRLRNTIETIEGEGGDVFII